jgi:FkbM family methyltransferase
MIYRVIRILKKNLSGILISAIRWMLRFSGGRDVCQDILSELMRQADVVDYRGYKMVFYVPNRLSRYRVNTFSTKEPETLKWIETIPLGKVLWDVGANIGLYSIYAASAQGCKVYAFEPSVFNLELLAKNITKNKQQELICIVPIALSDKEGSSMFKMSNTEWGGALSTFSESFGQDGEKLEQVFEYQTMGMTMDEAVRLFNIPTPNFIKIDVDGIEHFILRGGGETLRKVESVMVEVDDGFTEQAEETAYHLRNAGLTLKRKCSLGVGRQFNQWWVRGRD